MAPQGTWFDAVLLVLGLATAVYPFGVPWWFYRGRHSKDWTFANDLSLVAAAAFIQSIVAPFITFLIVLFIALPFQISVIWLDVFPRWGSLRFSLLLVGVMDLAIGVAVNRRVFTRWVVDGRLVVVERLLLYFGQKRLVKRYRNRIPFALLLLAIPLVNATLYSELIRLGSRPQSTDSDTPRMARSAWVVAHLDDLIHSGTIAAMSHISRPDDGSYADLLTIAQGGTPTDTLIRRAPVAGKYVVFSDLHLLEIGAKQGHFKNWGRDRGEMSNADVYLKMLDFYDREGYTVVEIGDIEDLLTQPPAYGEIWIDLFFDAFFGPFGNYFDYGFEREQRIHKLLNIGLNYQEHYAKLRKFNDAGRFIKVIGNHDESLKDSYVLNVLQKIYRGPLQTYDYLVLDDPASPVPEEARFIMAHGHQYDPYCATGAEDMIGEVFTESLAWFGSGPDRIWPRYGDAPPGWAGKMNRQVGFANHVSMAPSFLKEENVAFKFRHMDERRVVEEMKRLFKDPAHTPTLVLGHTHEPRDHAVASDGKSYGHYLNTGSAGLYEQLVWGVEVVGGVGSVHAWFSDPSDKTQVIHRKMEPTPDGRLVPLDGLEQTKRTETQEE